MRQVFKFTQEIILSTTEDLMEMLFSELKEETTRHILILKVSSFVLFFVKKGLFVQVLVLD